MGYADASSRRMIVNRFLVAAILCAGFSWTALAQTAADAPATKEDIEKYFEATHSHDMMLKMMDAMSRPLHQLAHDQCAKIQGKLPADCEAQINKSVDEMMKQIPFDEILQEMPAVMGDAMEAMMPIMRRTVDKMTERTQQQLAQMMKDSPKKAGENVSVQN
jgi:hypothetical protein